MSEAYLGRVINALAKPIDGRGEISASESRLIESPAPGMISRPSVYEPLQTGLIAIDSMIPIGRGQREFIIGAVFRFLYYPKVSKVDLYGFSLGC